MIDLNDLQVFARVVEAGGFAAAGRSLGLPVSSVSRKVARLERRLGVPLLRRTTRSLGLTEAGLLYHRHCERALAELGAAEAAMGGWHAAPRGTLRVSAPIAFGRFVLAPLLGAFAARHPEVLPVVVLTNRYVDLAEEGFDLAIRTGALPESGLRARRLGESALVVAASPACLARWGMPRARRDFERLPCLVLGEDTATARWGVCGGGSTGLGAGAAGRGVQRHGLAAPRGARGRRLRHAARLSARTRSGVRRPARGRG